MDKNIQKKIVDRIESLCAEKRIAKKELADRCDFSPTTFSTWKAFKREITDESLKKIADGLGVSVEYLKGEPERLTEAQAQLAFVASAGIRSLQKYLEKAISDPAWAKDEWERVQKHGMQQWQQDMEKERLK